MGGKSAGWPPFPAKRRTAIDLYKDQCKWTGRSTLLSEHPDYRLNVKTKQELAEVVEAKVKMDAVAQTAAKSVVAGEVTVEQYREARLFGEASEKLFLKHLARLYAGKGI